LIDLTEVKPNKHRLVHWFNWFLWFDRKLFAADASFTIHQNESGRSFRYMPATE